MAKHTVKFTLPERELGKADAEFRVKRDGAALGTLKVSNGTVVWVPKDMTYGYKIGWVDFDKLMMVKGTHEKNG
ncbi:MAG TPA: hypothetical protein VFT34_04525 [Verrucomicrobiae bacterium]|nr:hypothetical protein [Verrucomicrobiae bacterium]